MPALRPVGRLTSQLAIWTAMRRAAERGETITQPMIAKAARLRLSAVKEYTAKLVASGILAMAPRKPGETARYRIVRDVGVDAPRFRAGRLDEAPTAQQRIWAAVKALRDFSIAELQLVAEVPRATAARYVYSLTKAGYFVAAGERRWRLLAGRNTGPRPPAIVAGGKAVFDLNLNREMRP